MGNLFSHIEGFLEKIFTLLAGDGEVVKTVGVSNGYPVRRLKYKKNRRGRKLESVAAALSYGRPLPAFYKNNLIVF